MRVFLDELLLPERYADPDPQTEAEIGAVDSRHVKGNCMGPSSPSPPPALGEHGSELESEPKSRRCQL